VRTSSITWSASFVPASNIVSDDPREAKARVRPLHERTFFWSSELQGVLHWIGTISSSGGRGGR
jgi:hypothetical protein